MNTLPSEGLALAKDVIAKSAEVSSGVELVVIPPFTHLNEVTKLASGTRVAVGAQNCARWQSGAYTGEVSAAMLGAMGVEYVIIGHSERRTYFYETDETVNKKTLAALAAGLTPIVCVGETLDENQSGRTKEVVSRQVREGLKGIPEMYVEKIVIAYEPVWAIGTGLAATGKDANRVIAEDIRKPYADLYGEKAAQSIRVLYGGSVKGNNAAEFFGQPDIDGALVGGASLKAPDFMEIVNAAVK